MRYVITGTAGFIASHLTTKLLELGHEIVGIDNLVSGKYEHIAEHKDNPNFTFLKLDISNWNELSRNFNYFKGVAGIFHLAAKARIQFSIKNPYETHHANVIGTFNILEMMKMCGVKNIVFSSTSSMYGLNNKSPLVETMIPNCLNMYSLSKYVSEQYMKVYHDLYKLNSIILRFFNVYGPREKTNGEFATVIGKFYRQVLKDKSPVTIVGTGKQKRDFTSVYDIVLGNIKAMEAIIDNPDLSNEVFNLGSGKNYTVLEVTDMILDSVGQNKSFRTFIPPRPAEVDETLADITKARNTLGWEPKRDLETEIKNLALYYENLFS